jgi:hypothetical protein
LDRSALWLLLEDTYRGFEAIFSSLEVIWLFDLYFMLRVRTVIGLELCRRRPGT